MRPLTATIVIVALSAMSPTASSQQPDTLRDTARVAPVVVTATRTPLSRDRVPASVTVLDAAILRAQGITHVADALRLVPGVAIVQSGSYGAQTSLFTRGGQNNYTKVLVDGVPLNDPGGTLDISTLTLDNVERIEVVRGPTSVLYGSDAVTGVVQLFTRRGDGVPRASLDVRGGTYASYDVVGDAAGDIRGIRLSLGGGHHASDGIYRFNSQYRNDVTSAGVTVMPWAGADIRANGRYSDVSAHFPTDFTGAPSDPNSYRTERRTLLGAELRQRLMGAEAAVSVSSNLADASTVNPPNSPTDVLSTLASHTLRQGVDLRLTLPMFSIASVALGGMLERQHQASPNADRRNSATYVEMLHSGGRTTATAGARLDHSSTYGDFGTYRVSLSQVVAGALRVRGSVGTAFREPSFFESFDTPFSVANLALRPERTTTWETGVEGALARERLTMGVTYFHQRFVDLVDYRFSPSGSTYENIARARAAGAEVELRVVLPAAATADASYTFLDSKVLRSGFNPSPLATLHEGGPLLRRPTRSGSAGLSLPFAGGAALGARATYVGTREDRRFHGAPTFETDAVALNPYTKIDLAGTLPFALFLPTLHAVTASLRLDNAFGARYESVAGYATPGRTILAGLRADF